MTTEEGAVEMTAELLGCTASDELGASVVEGGRVAEGVSVLSGVIDTGVEVAGRVGEVMTATSPMSAITQSIMLLILVPLEFEPDIVMACFQCRLEESR